MKVTKDVRTTKEFQPVKITLEIESFEELASVWQRFNMLQVFLDEHGPISKDIVKIVGVKPYLQINDIYDSITEEIRKYIG